MAPRACPRGRRGGWLLLATVGAIFGVGLLGLASPALAQEAEEVEISAKPTPGYGLNPREVLGIARATEEVASQRAQEGRLEPHVYTDGPGRWRVGFFADDEEVAQIHIDDASGTVVEAWTGPQVAWKMARGYEGAFGRKFNAPYVFIPLGLLFLLPFVDPRRPLRILHLDLLVLLGFGISHVFFNRAEIFLSVPLVYPVLAYLLARMLWVGFRPRERRERLVPLVPIAALALLAIFLVSLRVTLNVADSGVVDVGYAGVVGADRIADGEGLYGTFPEEISHGDTYGPFNYLAYLPFEQALPWSGEWDDLPAAHAAAIAFDLLTMLGLLVLGRRLRGGRDGTALGVALMFAWASYPYTTFVLASNANDTLVAMLVVWALVALNSAPARGAIVALAGAAKFGPLALIPLFVRGASGGRRRGRYRRPSRRLADALRGPVGAALAVVAVLAASAAAFIPDGGLAEIYDRTVGYQAGRDSPFSVWGQAPSLGALHTAVQVAAVGLALVVAVVPRRRGAVQVAALGAAVLIAVQLAATHWFYFYVVWFAPLVFVALFGAYRGQAPQPHATSRGERRVEAPPAPVSA